jgi:hypothetical protein
MNRITYNCRVRSPNAPIKGVIGDHALQIIKNKMRLYWVLSIQWDEMGEG